MPSNRPPSPAERQQVIKSTRRAAGKRRTTKSLTPEYSLRIAEQLEIRGDSEDVAEIYEVPRPVVLDCAVRKLQREMRHVLGLSILRGSAELPIVDGFGKRKPMGREVVQMKARKTEAA